MACYLIAVVLVIGVISTYEVRTFSCNGRAIGQYCMKDLSGYYECKIIPKTDFKRYVIRKCSNEKRCSCDQAAAGCTRKICVNIASAPVNKRPRMSLSFTGSVVRWGWGNDAPREEQLEGEVFEDVHNKYYLKRLWKTGTPITDEKFELIRPEKNGDLIKYYGLKKYFHLNSTYYYRECYQIKLEEFPRLLDLTRFTLVNKKQTNSKSNQTLQTWTFRSQRQHRTTDQVRTTWKVLYDPDNQYLFPKKYRDVKKNMPGPRNRTPNQKGVIRSLVFKELNGGMSKALFTLPDYCKDMNTQATLQGFVTRNIS